MHIKDKEWLLRNIRMKMNGCERCTKLTKKNGTIFDNGNPDAEIMIIAEAAGADEEINCLPLIGRCGKLIEEMLAHIELTRKDTWRANVCACRPPENRDPTPEEISNCREFLHAQIAIVKPRILVLLGKFAAQTVLECSDPIGKMLGWHESEDNSLRAYVMYHPSYILRNGGNLISYYKAQFEEVKKALVV